LCEDVVVPQARPHLMTHGLMRLCSLGMFLPTPFTNTALPAITSLPRATPSLRYRTREKTHWNNLTLPYSKYHPDAARQVGQISTSKMLTFSRFLHVCLAGFFHLRLHTTPCHALADRMRHVDAGRLASFCATASVSLQQKRDAQHCGIYNILESPHTVADNRCVPLLR
jgi:hypothetical protein